MRYRDIGVSRNVTSEAWPDDITRAHRNNVTRCRKPMQYDL